MFPSVTEDLHPLQPPPPTGTTISYPKPARASAYASPSSGCFASFSTEAHTRNSLDDWVKLRARAPPIVTNLQTGTIPYVTARSVGTENRIPGALALNLLQHQDTKGFDDTHFGFARDLDGFTFGGVSNTGFDFGAKDRLSPLPLSPSPTSNYLCPGSYYYEASTPDLLTPESSPSTGKSRNILLTPGSGACPGINLPAHFDGSIQHSPVNGSHHQTSGATPSFIGLLLEDRPETRPSIDQGYADRGSGNFQATSDSLGLSHGTGEVQDSSLPPLDMGSDLIGIDSSASSNLGYNIEIRCSTPQNMPVAVVETQGGGDEACLSPCYLSPQQLEAFVIEYQAGSNAANCSDQIQASLTSPIAIAGQILNWESSHFNPHNSPEVIPRFVYHDRARSLSTSALPSSTFSRTRAVSFHPQTVSAAGNGTGSAQVQVPVQVHDDTTRPVIVNPRGVSQRMLNAARVNRTREPKFQCDICYDWQTSKQNLENHKLSRHMNIKRFVCTVTGCSKRYGHSRGLNRHLDSKHPGFRQTISKARRNTVKRAHT